MLTQCNLIRLLVKLFSGISNRPPRLRTPTETERTPSAIASGMVSAHWPIRRFSMFSSERGSLSLGESQIPVGASSQELLTVAASW